ncbi:MAG: 2-dehydropantoate 2-reductase [Actinomycetota bacterium]|jgi:2-dehydropantoate 2-reductase|nr:2-dehydropantoate 2-reductase [Actinomycetota bacterium]
MGVRYVVVGAGAVGGTIGGRLFEHGHDVVLVARGSHGEAIRAGGLRLRSADGEAVVTAPCVSRPDEVAWGPDDVVVMATKTQDSAAALLALAAVAPPSTPVVCAQNGVENERLALRLFERAYAMCVMLPAAHLSPGVVEVSSSPVSGILDLGRYPGGVDDVCVGVAADLSASTFSSVADPSVMRRKHAKLLMNLGNALEAACGSGARGSALGVAARAEAVACFSAAGIDYASDEEDRERRGSLLTPVGRQGSSSWQSLARGTGSIEADYLNGEIVLLGRLFGVATPVNALLQSVAGELARSGAAPGSMPLQELESRAVSVRALPS